MTQDRRAIAGGPSWFAGIDVGGTAIKFGLIDAQGRILARNSLPTPATPGQALEQLRGGLTELLAAAAGDWGDVAALGLGTPGPLDVRRGRILTPSNLPGWHDFPICDQLSQACGGRPVAFANDANAAAYGEFWVGGGQEASSLVMLTLGTGVGGGIIVDQLSIDGCHSHGSELGHLCVDTSPDARRCGCGQTGHLEAYASATALVLQTLQRLQAGSPSSLQDCLAAGSPIDARIIAEHAAAGDPLANELIAEVAEYLARAIADLAHAIDPELFVLGGAMNFGGPSSPLGRRFLARILESARRRTFPVIAAELTIVFSELGSDAGWIGAAGLARLRHPAAR